MRISFSNGWALSVVNHGYGSEQGLQEAALQDRSGSIAYGAMILPYVSAEFTGGEPIKGWLSPSGVAHLVGVVSGWPNCPDI